MTLVQLIIQGFQNEYLRILNNPLVVGTPYLLSFVTAYSVLMAGRLKLVAWKIGILNQLFWLTWIIWSNTWGFLLMNAVMWYVNIANLIKWRRENIEALYATRNKT